MKNFAVIIATMCCLVACSEQPETEKEITRELRLSVPQTVFTEDIYYEFDIVDGNQPYTASVSERDGEPDAIVTIEGGRVMVDILNGHAPTVTITDGKDQQKSVSITSFSETLNMSGYTLAIEQGDTYAMKIEFGAGAPYTIERTRGDAHTASIEGDRVVVRAADRLGDTHYKIRDRRGSVARFTVETPLMLEMDGSTKHIEFAGLNTMTAKVKLTWGSEWEIVEWTRNALEKVSVVRFVDFYVLFINTSDEGTGYDVVRLRNREGDSVVVSSRVD